MLDFGLFKIRTDIFLLILSVILMVLQIILCAKLRSKLIKLLPIIVLSSVTLVFTVLIFVFDGWDSIGFLLLAIWSAFLLAMCGVAWAVWYLFKKIKSRKKNEVSL